MPVDICSTALMRSTGISSTSTPRKVPSAWVTWAPMKLAGAPPAGPYGR